MQTLLAIAIASLTTIGTGHIFTILVHTTEPVCYEDETLVDGVCIPTDDLDNTQTQLTTRTP